MIAAKGEAKVTERRLANTNPELAEQVGQIDWNPLPSYAIGGIRYMPGRIGGLLGVVIVQPADRNKACGIEQI